MFAPLRLSVLSWILLTSPCRGGTDEEKPFAPWESPWLIDEIRRVDMLPLEESDRTRICLIPENLTFDTIFPQASTMLQYLHWRPNGDGSYDFSEGHLRSAPKMLGGQGLSGVSSRGQPRTRVYVLSPQKYLLISIRARKAVQFPKVLPVDGNTACGFRIVDGSGLSAGRLIGLYQMHTKWKILIFEGSWTGVTGLSLRDHSDHEERLLGEFVPFPYRAVGLSESQVRRIEAAHVSYLNALEQQRVKYIGAVTANQKKQEDEAKRLRTEAEYKVEKMLTRQQREILDRLRRDPAWTSEAATELPTMKVVSPDQMPWRIVAVTRHDDLPAERLRWNMFGILGTSVRFYDPDSRQRTIRQVGGSMVTAYSPLSSTKTPRYLLVELKLNESPSKNGFDELKKFLGPYLLYSVRERDGQSRGDFRVVLYGDLGISQTVFLLFEGDWPRGESLMLCDASGNACELVPALQNEPS